MSPWVDRFRSAAPAIVLFVVQFLLLWPFARLEYGPFWTSAEGQQISLARYIVDNFPDLEWFPLWAGGIPFQNAGAPLIPGFTALVSAATGWSEARAYHLVVGLFLALAAPGLFWLARRLGASEWGAAAAALLYATVSPATLLAPSIREAVGGFLQRRVYFSASQDEAGLAVALAILPLALLALDSAIAKPGWASWLRAAVVLPLVPLASWQGLPVAIVAVVLFVSASPLRQRWWKGAILTIAAWMLAAPWFVPSTLFTIWENSRNGPQYYHFGFLEFVLMAALLAAAVYACLWFRRSRRVALAFALPLAAFAATLWLVFGYTGYALFPQPHRWAGVAEWAIALVAGIALGQAVSRMPKPGQAGISVALLLICAAAAIPGYWFLSETLVPGDPATRLEYRAARWLTGNMPDARVMASGSTSLWLNAFSPNPQVGTAFEYGTINWQNRIARQTVLTGEHLGYEDAPISTVWLKAFGARAVVAGGPVSQAAEFGFRSGRKFDGVLPRLWSDGEDVIYGVPASDSLVHVITPNSAITQYPEDGLDTSLIERYLVAVEDGSRPNIVARWLDSNHVLVTGMMRSDQLLSVQMSWHRGWNATVRGHNAPIQPDGLGQMLVRPRCDGACAVMIWYDGGAEMGTAYIVRYIALSSFLLWALYSWYRRRSAKRRQPAAAA